VVAIDVSGVDDGIDDGIEILAQVARVVVVHLAAVAPDRDVRLDERVALRHQSFTLDAGATMHFGEAVDVVVYFVRS